MIRKNHIQIISAPSILGLKEGGVAELGDSLLSAGLAEKLEALPEVFEVPAPNHLYNKVRDDATSCLNPDLIRAFSKDLSVKIQKVIGAGHFPLVLGGDCSIIIGTMHALKTHGDHGLIFLDAHADFYRSEQSTTGEVADMDLAIVTGRGPSRLSDIDGLSPYVEDHAVIQIAQRDGEEARSYGAQDLKTTAINCFDLNDIRTKGLNDTMKIVITKMMNSQAKTFWLHFDTDVINDVENPAVDYRIPGGLTFKETIYVIKQLMATGKVSGMTVTIFNPWLDGDGSITKQITNCIANGLSA